MFLTLTAGRATRAGQGRAARGRSGGGPGGVLGWRRRIFVLTIPPPCPLWNPVVTHLHGNWHRLTGVVRGREQACSPVPIRAPAVRSVVNAGEKMYQRAGVKLHHRGVPNAPPEGFLLHDKQDEKRIASSANVPETSSVASPSVLPLPQSIVRPASAPLLNPKSMLTDVGPVELWATRWRRPSAAANPQGFCWQ